MRCGHSIGTDGRSATNWGSARHRSSAGSRSRSCCTIRHWRRFTPELPAVRDTATVNPFKGLRSFGEEDAADFFGRDRLVSDVVRRIDAGQRLVATGRDQRIGQVERRRSRRHPGDPQGCDRRIRAVARRADDPRSATDARAGGGAAAIDVRSTRLAHRATRDPRGRSPASGTARAALGLAAAARDRSVRGVVRARRRRDRNGSSSSICSVRRSTTRTGASSCS